MNILENQNRLNDFIHKILLWYFIIIFIGTAFFSILSYLEHCGWVMGDWLINYSGGFVRRGLVGQCILSISHVTTLNAGIITIIVQMLCYAIFLVFCYKMLVREANIVPWALLIFSPFIFTFQLHQPEGGFRKEIIYFALLSIISWAKMSYSNSVFRRFFLLVLLIYPVLILSHEMLAVFLPYLFAVYFINIQVNSKMTWVIAIATVPSVICFLLVCGLNATVEQELAIVRSLAVIYPVHGGSAIAWLHRSAFDGFNHTRGSVNSCVNGSGASCRLSSLSHLRFLL